MSENSCLNDFFLSIAGNFYHFDKKLLCFMCARNRLHNIIDCIEMAS